MTDMLGAYHQPCFAERHAAPARTTVAASAADGCAKWLELTQAVRKKKAAIGSSSGAITA